MLYNKINLFPPFLHHRLFRYTVMSGTPEKILEHLLETIKLDSNGNDAIGGSPRASSGLFCFLFYSVTLKNWIDLAG